MGIDVRPARPADIEALQRVSRRAWHAAHEPIVGADAVEEFLDDYYDAETFRSRIEDEDAILDVAVDAADSPVGFVLANPTGNDATFGLSRLYVHPDRWGEGIGRRLLSNTEGKIERRGGERVQLGVMAENERAIGFYESAGFTRSDEFYDDRVGTTGYTYEKELEPADSAGSR